MPGHHLAGPLGSVEYLDLGKNHLSTIDATLFSGLRGLRIVNLDNNAITSIAPGAFANNPLLELVLLRGNPVGCSTIQAELPEGAVCHERGFCDSTMCSAFCDESGGEWCYNVECKARVPSNSEFGRSGQPPVVSTEEVAEDYGSMTCRNGLTPSPMLLLRGGESAACKSHSTDGTHAAQRYNPLPDKTDSCALSRASRRRYLLQWRGRAGPDFAWKGDVRDREWSGHVGYRGETES